MNSTVRVKVLNIEKELMDIEGNFTYAVIEIVLAFGNSSIELDVFKTALHSLPITSISEQPKLLAPYKSDISDINTVTGLFEYLSGLYPPLWDIRNYDLLLKLSEVFLKDYFFNIQKLIDEHSRRLEEFEKKTSFCLYSKARRGADVIPSKHYELIDIELQRTCMNYSISEYELVRRDFFVQILKLTPYSVYFHKESEGSIHQWWSIPKSIIPYLKKELPKTKSFCDKHGIVSIRLNGVDLLASKFNSNNN